MLHNSLYFNNVGKTMPLSPPIWEWMIFYHLLLAIWGMVSCCFTHITVCNMILLYESKNFLQVWPRKSHQTTKAPAYSEAWWTWHGWGGIKPTILQRRWWENKWEISPSVYIKFRLISSTLSHPTCIHELHGCLKMQDGPSIYCHLHGQDDDNPLEFLGVPHDFPTADMKLGNGASHSFK